MAAYTDWICERVLAGDPEAFLGAHEVVREFRVNSSDGGGCEPWATRIKTDPPASEDVAKIRLALLDALATGNDLAISGAAFALAEFHDPSLTSVLRDQLHRQLHAMLRLHGGLHNLLFALASSGEDVPLIPSGGSVEESIVSARSYLKKAGMEAGR